MEAQKRLKVTAEVAKPAEIAVLHSRMSEIAVSSGFAENEQELNTWNRNVTMELANYASREPHRNETSS